MNFLKFYFYVKTDKNLSLIILFSNVEVISDLPKRSFSGIIGLKTNYNKRNREWGELKIAHSRIISRKFCAEEESYGSVTQETQT